MDMSGTNLMSLLAQKMSYLNQKETVHAQNVANASTPGYQAMELEPFSFQSAMKNAQAGTLLTTDPHHMVPVSMSGGNSTARKVKTYGASPDHNAVDAEQESMKVSQTSVEYQLVTSIYHKFAGLFKIALKGSAS